MRTTHTNTHSISLSLSCPMIESERDREIRKMWFIIHPHHMPPKSPRKLFKYYISVLAMRCDLLLFGLHSIVWLSVSVHTFAHRIKRRIVEKGRERKRQGANGRNTQAHTRRFNIFKQMWQTVLNDRCCSTTIIHLHTHHTVTEHERRRRICVFVCVCVWEMQETKKRQQITTKKK